MQHMLCSISVGCSQNNIEIYNSVDTNDQKRTKMTKYDTGNPLWYCFMFPIFPMVLLLGLWCYFGWLHEKLVKCGAAQDFGLA